MDHGTEPVETPASEGNPLEQLVGAWLTVPDIAERLDVPLSRVRRLLDDRDLLSWRVGPRNVIAVPEAFFDAEGVRPDLRGTFTVLADGGMNDEEVLTWLFTPDETLPEGSPMAALVAGHKREIRRRAQALAF